MAPVDRCESADASRAECADEVEEDIVTMCDVEATAAVLGSTDSENCSYDRGYVDRQPLYSCLTCMRRQCNSHSGENLSEFAAGICLACSIHCHADHELVELYTKRGFRCDCGNDKFEGKKCQLISNKDKVNGMNKYNHNFVGTYCTCKRPYPDPDVEDSEERTTSEMVQCVVCEDWYHIKHLHLSEGDQDIYNTGDTVSFEELICSQCSSRHPWLLRYTDNAPTEIVLSSNECAVSKSCPIATYHETNRLKKLPCNPDDDNNPASPTPSLFMRDVQWRRRLCKCDECTRLYSDSDVTFLTDLNDTIQHYESRSGGQTADILESKAWQSLDRTTQIEAIHAYTDFEQQLKSYLRKFADEDRVVTADDIKSFFAELQASRSSQTRLHSGGIQHFCGK